MLVSAHNGVVKELSRNNPREDLQITTAQGQETDGSIYFPLIGAECRIGASVLVPLHENR